MENNKRVVLTLALVAVIAVAAIGIGYAYTASTSNSDNDVELKYLTMVPTKSTGAQSYSADFDDQKVKYDSETREALNGDVRTATTEQSAIAVGNPIIIYTLSPETFNAAIGGSATNNAMKVGEIFLQIDERNSPAGDTYYILFKAETESKTTFNTDGFEFKVGFQVDYREGATAPVTNPNANLDSNPGAEEVVSYATGVGAVSPSITNHASGFTIVKVTLWLTGVKDALEEQKFLVSDIYPTGGTPKAPQQPMTGVKLTFEAIVPEVLVTGLSATTEDASIDLSEGETTTVTASVTPNNASISNVKWVIVTGDDKVSVDASGVVKPLAVGTATIKAVALDGSNIESDTVGITVTD